jgi:hypothetical protein
LRLLRRQVPICVARSREELAILDEEQRHCRGEFCYEVGCLCEGKPCFTEKQRCENRRGWWSEGYFSECLMSTPIQN